MSVSYCVEHERIDWVAILITVPVVDKRRQWRFGGGRSLEKKLEKKNRKKIIISHSRA